jgi:hypothetical protein
MCYGVAMGWRALYTLALGVWLSTSACGDGSDDDAAGGGATGGGSGSDGAPGTDGGSDDGDGGSGGDGGGSQGGCSGNRVDIDRDDEEFSFLEPHSSAMLDDLEGLCPDVADFNISMASKVVENTPFYSLSIEIPDHQTEAPTEVQLTDANSRVAWNPNSGYQVANYEVGAANYALGTVSGTVDIEQDGTSEGDIRCGSFDLTLTWDDPEGSHELTANADFEAILTHIQCQ